MALTVDQLKFLAARLLVGSDGKAAEQAGVSESAVCRWKRESPEFARAYQVNGEEAVQVAKQYTRKLLGKMAQVYDEALDATIPTLVVVGTRRGEDGQVEATEEKELISRPDWKTRLAAAEAVGKIHGLFVHKTELSGPNGRPVEVRQVPTMDLSGLTDDELEQLEKLLRKAAPREAAAPSLVGAES